MSLTARSTKAEIWQAYQGLVARPVTAAMVGQWISQTAQTVAAESVLLVKDCYKAGQVARSWYDSVVAELSRPILKKS